MKTAQQAAQAWEQSAGRAATNYSDAVVKMLEDARRIDRENRREFIMSVDEARREYIGNIDGVAKKQEDSMSKLATVIDKLGARLSGRARTH